jgi:predicted lipoprotein with Yx(FWY)xxD motif
VSTVSGAHGTYLTGPSGRALYLWVADSSGKSVCSGACAKAVASVGHQRRTGRRPRSQRW